jgi:hypothetical protein
MRVEKGVKSLKLNDNYIEGPIPIQSKGSLNEVEVVMG